MGWVRSNVFIFVGKLLDVYVDKIYIFYEVGFIKLDFGIFNYMIKDSKLNLVEIIFVDDGVVNIVIGKELGFIMM